MALIPGTKFPSTGDPRLDAYVAKNHFLPPGQHDKTGRIPDYGTLGFGNMNPARTGSGGFGAVGAPVAAPPFRVDTDPFTAGIQGGVAGTQAIQDAYTSNFLLLKGFGVNIEALGPEILRLAQSGLTDPDTFQLMLQQSQPFKDRFPANDLRIKAGLPVLSPGQYFNQEQAYRQALSKFGLPASFYDQNSDFTDWMAQDVDPVEVQQRAQIASNWVNNTDPNARKALLDFYGIDDGHLVAYALDRKRSEPLLEKQANSAGVGAAAFRNGLSANASRSEYLTDAGVTAAEAQAGYGTVGELTTIGQKLSSIWGGEYNQTTAEDDALLNLASARRRRDQLTGSETAAFSGNSGVGKLAKSTAGQV